jgi:hypothetical protein
VLSGQRLAETGETTPLDGAELGKAWQSLRKRYGKEFTLSSARAAAWDRRGAAECERRQLWAGAIRHLDRLIAQGASADLSARRARANAELRNGAGD